MAACTRRVVCGDTSRPANTRDTVIFDTPASLATSAMRGTAAGLS
jgi:hypothetical protein